MCLTGLGLIERAAKLEICASSGFKVRFAVDSDATLHLASSRMACIMIVLMRICLFWYSDINVYRSTPFSVSVFTCQLNSFK